ncbi:MAG: U32 family peptidase [Lachnospiraceae bacterium]|nr:U32 family peptidase [Lachnospiraceae bacterium]
MELLSPAGNYEAFKGAVNAGCDAVYLGGTRFGARAYADNFSDEEIIRAIRYAHLFDIKVYLTVNTLVKESEWQDVLDYIRPFYEAGLDGCIVQDIGLISVFPILFPEMECHVSTQGYATGKFAARFYKSFGSTRVVLARELSMDELKEVGQSEGVEVEAFVHGAMCYAYSGNCLFSSCLGGRSGNRGRCAGPCRLEYSVISNNKESKPGFYLSMKDQCAVELIPELSDNEIDSLKIEGRMKKPEYSAFVTSQYRKYIERYNKDPERFNVDHKDIEDLKHMYLRSEYGQGYYHRDKGKEMISVDSPAYNGNDDKLMESTKETYLRAERKRTVDLYFYEQVGENLILTATSDGISVTVEGPVAERAVNKAASSEDIRKQLVKLGDTSFKPGDITINSDDQSFIPVSVLNELRRNLIDKLENAILKDYKERIQTKAINKPVFSVDHDKEFIHKPIITVTLKEQADALSKVNGEFYTAVPVDLIGDFKGRSTENDFLLDLPLVMRDKDEAAITSAVKTCETNGFKGIICHNTEELGLSLSLGYKGFVILGPEIYAWNRESVKVLSEFSHAIMASYELTGQELMSLPDDLFVCVYGRMPLMNSANCIERTAFSCKKKEGSAFIGLKDRRGVTFPVRRNCDLCFNTIYNSVPTSLHREVNTGKIKKSCMVINFTNESASDVYSIADSFINGSPMPSGEYTRGYRQRGVE